MSKAKATVAEQALQDAMRKRGCAIGGTASPEIHHINAEGMKRKEWAIIPLSPGWHRGVDISLHRNKSSFRRALGHEWTIFFEILNEVINDLKPEHRTEILQKIDDYKESGHASVQFLQAYDKGRVGE